MNSEALPTCGVTWLTGGFQPCRALERQRSSSVDVLGHSPAGAAGTVLRVLGLSRALQPPHTHPCPGAQLGLSQGVFQCVVEALITLCCY